MEDKKYQLEYCFASSYGKSVYKSFNSPVEILRFLQLEDVIPVVVFINTEDRLLVKAMRYKLRNKKIKKNHESTS